MNTKRQYLIKSKLKCSDCSQAKSIARMKSVCVLLGENPHPKSSFLNMLVWLFEDSTGRLMTPCINKSKNVVLVYQVNTPWVDFKISHLPSFLWKIEHKINSWRTHCKESDFIAIWNKENLKVSVKLLLISWCKVLSLPFLFFFYLCDSFVLFVCLFSLF